jgi:hypothetical protein
VGGNFLMQIPRPAGPPHPTSGNAIALGFPVSGGKPCGRAFPPRYAGIFEQHFLIFSRQPSHREKDKSARGQLALPAILSVPRRTGRVRVLSLQVGLVTGIPASVLFSRLPCSVRGWPDRALYPRWKPIPSLLSLERLP